MPPTRLLPAQFMHVSKEVRDYIAAMWKLDRSGVSEIRDQDVISDGHTYDDLGKITLELMCEYIGSEESFARAWELTCMRAYSELHPPVGIIDTTKEIREVADEVTEEPTPIKNAFDISHEEKSE